MGIFLNLSCLWWRQREKTHTLLVPLFVIRGYLCFLRPSRSSFTLWSLLRGWSVSLVEYFVKNWTSVVVFEGWQVFFGNVDNTKEKKTHTRLVALFVIRGYLGYLRPSTSRFTLWCLLRGWFFCLLQYFVKNWTWGIVFEGQTFILWER